MKIWILEFYSINRWISCNANFLKKKDALAEKRRWLNADPDEKLRVTPYIPETDHTEPLL